MQIAGNCKKTREVPPSRMSKKGREMPRKMTISVSYWKTVMMNGSQEC